MSHNYTKYYNKPQGTPTTEPEVKAPVEEPVVEETTVTPDETVTPQVDPESTVEPVADDKADTILGVVTECAKLNVRKEPLADAEVLTTIPLAAEVQVDISESTNGFYKVCTGAGVEGYCVEKYINID